MLLKKLGELSFEKQLKKIIIINVMNKVVSILKYVMKCCKNLFHSNINLIYFLHNY